VTAEEALVDRLQYVLGVYLGPQPTAELAAGEADEAASEAAEHLAGGVGVAGVEAGHQVVESGEVRHGRAWGRGWAPSIIPQGQRGDKPLFA